MSMEAALVELTFCLLFMFWAIGWAFTVGLLNLLKCPVLLLLLSLLSWPILLGISLREGLANIIVNVNTVYKSDVYKSDVYKSEEKKDSQ